MGDKEILDTGAIRDPLEDFKSGCEIAREFKKVDHPNLGRIIEVCPTTSDKPWIVEEYFGPDIKSTLDESQQFGGKDIDDWKWILYCCLKALSHLHSLGWAHCGIK